jgi:hypothetical protein
MLQGAAQVLHRKGRQHTLCYRHNRVLAVQLAELRAVLRWLDIWRHVMKHLRTVIAADHSFLPGLLKKLAVRYTLCHSALHCTALAPTASIYIRSLPTAVTFPNHLPLAVPLQPSASGSTTAAVVLLTGHTPSKSRTHSVAEFRRHDLTGQPVLLYQKRLLDQCTDHKLMRSHNHNHQVGTLALTLPPGLAACLSYPPGGMSSPMQFPEKACCGKPV